MLAVDQVHELEHLVNPALADPAELGQHPEVPRRMVEVEGGLRMGDLLDELWTVDFGREYPELGEVTGVDTMGGLLMTEMEVLPGVGQSVVFRGLRLTAQVVDERRIRELLVERVRKR